MKSNTTEIFGMGKYCVVELHVLMCVYEVGYCIKCISYYGSQAKELAITALKVDSVAFQNINIYCHGTINTVHLSKQCTQLRVPPLTEEADCLALCTG